MKQSGKRAFGAKKIAFLALTSALALVSFLLESLLPALPLPGAKIGLSNVFTLLPLLFFGTAEALLVVTVKTVLGSLFAGNFSLLLYSFTAGVVSTLAARFLLCFVPKISIVCVSVASAVVHNMTQLLVYCFLTKTVLLFVYAPYLALLGAAAGGAVGIVVVTLVKTLPLPLAAKNVLFRRERTQTEVS